MNASTFATMVWRVAGLFLILQGTLQFVTALEAHHLFSHITEVQDSLSAVEDTAIVPAQISTSVNFSFYTSSAVYLVGGILIFAFSIPLSKILTFGLLKED